MSNDRPLNIAAPKGRPMLSWVGKRPLRTVAAYPAQHIETFDPVSDAAIRKADPWKEWPAGCPHGGLLFHGDNKEVLGHLLANGFRGKVNLIYIDPPFDSAANYVRRVSLRGPKGAARMEGEAYTLGEQLQYSDIWANDNYLQFMYERLMLLRELLADQGSIWLHCDWRRAHHLRMLLDEVFGPEQFINEIAWKHTVLGGTHGRGLSKAHETLFWYSKGDAYLINAECDDARVPFGEYIQKTIQQDAEGRWYYTRGRMSRQPSEKELHEKPFTVTYVDDPAKGTLVSDIWDDMPAYRVYGDENAEYPTQKNESLVGRIVGLASEPGDLILDCFVGSGTTAAIAQKLGRRWITCDINRGAIQTTSKRLQATIQTQISEGNSRLTDIEDAKAPPPAQLSFSVWRVNDYDLQVQHNEAVEIACQAIGVQRTRTDSFFAGTRGEKTLVRVVPFNHPLSVTDLEEIKRELEARPGEERDVLVVCLGKELAADAWLEDYNRLRRAPTAANRIAMIELRTDARYGGFLQHEPATARVTVEREDEGIAVTINDFCSPTIIKRLPQQGGIVQAQVDDWRQMVDCVMIDPAYDGEVFAVALSDVPDKKTDYVQGDYRLPAPDGDTTVAVKIIDMLGEEVLVTARV